MARSSSDYDGMTTREKLILSGLYLSKFDSLGVRALGFDSFAEAFNAIGYGLGSRPASVKNYRDEFDPHFPNQRVGWHKRPTRDFCQAVLSEYNALDFDSFTGLIRSFFEFDRSPWRESASSDEEDATASAFAQRLITGLAAERYFESVYDRIPEFEGRLLENTTRFGCGFDFRLSCAPNPKEFLAVEVKGLKEQTGGLSMTPKEYDVAGALQDRFFLFVVRNFRESPTHTVFRNPLSSGLQFRRTERVIIQASWQTSI